MLPGTGYMQGVDREKGLLRGNLKASDEDNLQSGSQSGGKGEKIDKARFQYLGLPGFHGPTARQDG